LLLRGRLTLSQRRQLTQLDRPDEACHVGELALASNNLVASNLWQASELDAAFTRGYDTLPEAQGFHERYLSARRAVLGGGHETPAVEGRRGPG
jgi:hypothetical protein